MANLCVFFLKQTRKKKVDEEEKKKERKKKNPSFLPLKCLRVASLSKKEEEKLLIHNLYY